jgi:hypothetical protein
MMTFGPGTCAASGRCARRAGKVALKRDVDAYHEHYKVEAGLHIRREYLVTIGERR